MASSKTGARPVWASKEEGRSGRKVERRCRPRERMRVEGSSRRVKRGGVKRFQAVLTVSTC